MGDLLLSKSRIKILIIGVFMIFVLLALQLVR
ncbi:MAG: hypothetical protein RLZZ120_317, partial [Actinomycetota bacterium]